MTLLCTKSVLGKLNHWALTMNVQVLNNRLQCMPEVCYEWLEIGLDKYFTYDTFSSEALEKYRSDLCSNIS